VFIHVSWLEIPNTVCFIRRESVHLWLSDLTESARPANLVICWSTEEDDKIFRIETEQADEAFLHCNSDYRKCLCHIYLSVLYTICATYR